MRLQGFTSFPHKKKHYNGTKLYFIHTVLVACWF